MSTTSQVSMTSSSPSLSSSKTSMSSGATTMTTSSSQRTTTSASGRSSTSLSTSSSSRRSTTTSTPSTTASAVSSTATLTSGGLYYPIYPYYKVTVEGQQYNVTWISAQSATGSGVGKPYAYPIVQSSSLDKDGMPFGVKPLNYPEGAYPCSVTVDGASYTGACSLGGRDGRDHANCNDNNNNGNDTGTGKWGDEHNDNSTGKNSNYENFPESGNMGNNTDHGNKDGGGMAKPCTLSLPGFNGTNTQIQDAIQVSTSCLTAEVPGMSGQPIMGTYFDLAFYDTTGNFTGMQAANLTCHGYYTSAVPAIMSSWDFPCKPVGNNISDPLPPTQTCQISDVPEVQGGPQYSVTQAWCTQNVTLNPGNTPYITSINATCTTYFNPQSGYMVTYFRGPCYNIFPTQVMQPNGSYVFVMTTVGTTCTYQDNSAPTSSTGPAPCTRPINTLINGSYQGTSLQPANCTSYQTPTAAYEIYQYSCFQWNAGDGYSPATCYGTAKQYPGLVSTTYAPCMGFLGQHYVDGVLFPNQNVNTTCATYTQFNGQYNYTQTSYMFPCQQQITFDDTGNSSVPTSYIDATCESQYTPMQMNGNKNCEGNNCGMGDGGMKNGSMYNDGQMNNNGSSSNGKNNWNGNDITLWAISTYMDMKSVPNYFNGSKVMPKNLNANVTVFSYGNESLKLWRYAVS
ncbi:hypothetical protein HDU86_003856 [Geranomyces michiganensis]|nr:hypothetical protein HDU86_003856 [Geranomyces michiganensis]